ncbi:hypothetical protein CH253_03945 [Rhodococcus sp. 06-156-3C]|uniref:hypothetical protein n=1 Tax=Nocardiaceae TaxID=85025 RepID=UPI000522EB0E|nr:MULTISPECIES: hypothetical protein [Rhodococcus]OZD17745.1 hypothetical protein CH280_07920 [Rhodococcus sp. 06-156-4C]OZD21454.1 hypothetical protein CH248_10100 [Rhodococcus sp. 06-156-4a]OZD23999.1 hypothetical protein CH247_28910 [Rhodococcus sp. 06-156-3b]OZD25172.1 hypothetical protein CH253_03945 [Rhodococcus sp. 06-156-3C]OZD40116.1 hypothetical protein CH284_03670 [Rhodococcus sp. 06-156-3]
MADEFTWSQFSSIVLIFVGVPTVIGGCAAWSALWSERARFAGQTGSGRVGVWGTGWIAFVGGFVACAGWLSWSADYRGEVRGPGLPAPNQFLTWQVVACGATVVGVCFGAARLSRWVRAGGLAAALGTAGGFTTAFAVSASTDSTGQAGVGVLLSQVGWLAALVVLMLVRAKILTRNSRTHQGPTRRTGTSGCDA